MKSKIKILSYKNIIAYVSDLTLVAQEGIDVHKTLPLPSLALSTAIVVFGPLGIIKKSECVSCMLSGDGPLKNILVESNNNGNIRALVGNPNVITEYDDKNYNNISINIGIGQVGKLKIVNFNNGKNFGGEVKLAKGDVVTDLAYYFDQSEQIKSAVQSSVKLLSPNKLERAFSVIYQMLPNHSEEDINHVEELIKTKPISMFKTIDEFINSIKFNVLDEKKISWKCSCTYQKIIGIINTMTEVQKDEIIKKYGKIEVTCNFCNKVYTYNNN